MFDQQTIKDLEFSKIRQLLHEYCVEETAKGKVLEIQPFSNQEAVTRELSVISDYKEIKEEEHSSFPRLEFKELKEELVVLRIKGTTLEIESIIKIYDASLLVNEMLNFLRKREEEFHFLRSEFESVFFTKEILDAVEQVLDKRFKIKDDASKVLSEIRQQTKSTRKQVNRNFDRALKKYQGKGYLGDTNESFFRGRRVLSVVSSYKRMIGGKLYGASKSGHLTYVEPPENALLNNQLEQLEEDERAEVLRILKELTTKIRVNYELVKAYQSLLVRLDFFTSKNKIWNKNKRFSTKIY